MSDQMAVSSRRTLTTGLLLSAGVSVALGVYGRVHEASYTHLPAFGFSNVDTFKAWLASLVLLLVLAQLAMALWMYGKLPGVGEAPARLGTAHRVTGYTAFVLSLPVAAYCLYGFGFAPSPMSTRTLVHSIAGCAFYGAFSAKVVVVHTRRLPGWAIPLAGGVLFSVFVLLWLTSALWWFTWSGVHL
jgi:Family of unknown function (DUF6529)